MNRTEYLLVGLSEECSEVAKEISKALRFGLDDCNPNAMPSEVGITNSQKITQEIADFIGSSEMLFLEGIIKRPNILDIEKKKDKIKKYIKYAESRGTLQKEHNKIVLDYKSDNTFGSDSINIDIKNTSMGALVTLQKDLEKLSVKWQKNNNKCWHPVTDAYLDLLAKLSTDLKKTLSEEK